MKQSRRTAKTIPSLRDRSQRPEIMDDLEGDESMLRRTLKRFWVINRLVSRSRHLLSDLILRDVTERRASRFSILDVGAGGCDLMIWLSKAAKARGLIAEITCADLDPRAVRYAREATAVYPNINVVEADVLAVELGSFDYVFCNHLLHHLSDQQVVEFVQRVETMARHRYVLNDIRRCRFAYVGITLLAGLLYPNSLAFHDGRTSVERSFRPDELEELFADYWPDPTEAPHVQCYAPARLVVTGSS